MTRKSRKLKNETKAAAQKLLQLQKLEEEAKKEEQAILDDARAQIEAICKNAGLFCGMILNPTDLGSIVTMAAGSPDKQTQVTFNLYFQEEKEIETK